MIIIGYSKGKLQVFKGSIKNGKIVQKCFSEVEINEKLIINGIIQDPDEYASSLKRLIKKAKLRDKNTTVLIDSSSIVYRDMQVPRLTNREIENLVYHTFDTQLPKIEDYVIDFSIVEETDKGKRILCAAVPSMLVETYKTAFRKAGLKLDKATTGISALITMNNLVKAQNTISIANNGDVLSCTIFNNSKYDFNSVTRLSNKQAPEQEILQRIDQVVQFERVQNPSYSYDTIYGIGVENERMRQYTDTSIGFSNATSAHCFSSVSTDAVLLSVNTVKKSLRQFNLVKGINQKKIKNKGDSRSVILMLSAAMLVNILILAGVYGYKQYECYVLRQEYAAIQDKYNDSVFSDHYAKATMYMGLNEQIEIQVKEYDAVNTYLKANSKFTYTVFANIFNMSDNVTVTQYSYNDGVLQLQASGSGKGTPYEFVEQLIASNMFVNVEYSGYSYNESEQSYSFVVTAILKEVD